MGNEVHAVEGEGMPSASPPKKKGKGGGKGKSLPLTISTDPWCSACPLRGKPRIPSRPPRDGRKPRLVLVLDHPSRHEETGQGPLAGLGGEHLARGIRHAGLHLDDVHVTHATECKPDGDRDAKAAARCCAPRLLGELRDLPSDVPIATAGQAALETVSTIKAVSHARGFRVVVPPQLGTADPKKTVGETGASVLRKTTTALRHAMAGRVLHPTLSVADVVRRDVLSPLWYCDWRRVGRHLSGGAHTLADEGEHVTGGPEILSRLTGKTLALDIETDGVDPLTAKILCVGLSDGPTTVVLHPWHDAYGHMLERWLRDNGKELVAHNGFGFDTICLERHGMNFDGLVVHDTLLAHHAYASHLPQRLDQVVSETLDANAWKITYGQRDATGAKKRLPKDMTAEDLAHYNAVDCRLTAKAWTILEGNPSPLTRERKVYDHDLELAWICRGMTMAGIGVDLERRTEVREAIVAKQAGLLEILRAIGGEDYEPSKPAHNRRVLFQTLGLRPLEYTDTGLPSTSDLLLESYRGEDSDAGRFCQALAEWRVADKIRSTYIDECPPHADGRYHVAWKPFGTVSGRLSCRLQSVPRHNPKTPEGRIREFYVPRPGHRFVYYDVSQAEMRLAAYLSADPVFMAACGADLHAGNAKNVFPEIAAKGWLDDKDALKDPARGKPFRDIAKNLGFAIAYGADAPTVHVNLASKGFKVTLQIVEGILAKLQRAYRVYYAFVDRNVQLVQRTGFMRTPVLGRIRYFGHYPKATEISNFPVQSALADIVNSRMIAVRRSRYGRLVALVAQIHDACIYEVPEALVDEFKAFIAELWAEPVPLPGGPLVLPIDLKVGDRWSDF